MMRIGQERLRGVAAMAGLANDTTDTPRRRMHRARGAQRLASALARCASRGRRGGVIASHCRATLRLKAGVLLSKVSVTNKCMSLRRRAGMMN